MNPAPFALPQSVPICGGMKGLLVRLALVAVLGAGVFYTLPQAWRGLELAVAAEKDPAKLADMRLRGFDVAAATNEIEAALKAGDAELAASFVALAGERAIDLPKELLERVEKANSTSEAAKRGIYNFAHGFITGEPQDVSGFAGAATGDLLVFGDIRDMVREGSRWARGMETDPLIMGLAGAGLAVTGVTYFTWGSAAPARVGTTLVKVARRTGKLSVKLADDVMVLLKARRTGRVTAALTDVAQIQRKAGTRVALESMRHADNVGDLAKAGLLAEKKGKSTLAIFKTLGRGAIAVGAGALAIAGWVVGAASSLMFFVVAVVSFFAAVLRWIWPSRTPEPARRHWTTRSLRWLSEPFWARPASPAR
jgi:hypothetical protein